MQINFLEETEEVLRQHNFTWNTVKFISNAEGLVEIAKFVSAAKICCYDNEGEDVKIDPTLIIAGGSWWLSRVLISNREQWFFHKKPPKPTLKTVDFSPTTSRNEDKIHRI